MNKPIREEYYQAPHLQHLSAEKREELYLQDLRLYNLQKAKEPKDFLEFDDADNDEIII